jgi:hypothetical protein
MSIEESDMDRVHDVFEINVFGVMYGSRAAMTEMRKQGNGIIMNIISSAALGSALAWAGAAKVGALNGAWAGPAGSLVGSFLGVIAFSYLKENPVISSKIEIIDDRLKNQGNNIIIAER